MKISNPPYKSGKLGTISDLHFRVIHGETDFTTSEYHKEFRMIARLNANQLALVCSTCFPLREPNQPVSRNIWSKVGKKINAV